MSSHDQVLTRLLRISYSLFAWMGRYVNLNEILFAAVNVLAAVSFWLSYELRFDFDVPRQWAVQRLFLLPYVAVLKMVVFYLVRGHAASWRYVGLSDIPPLVLHSAICALVLFLLPAIAGFRMLPRSVILIDFLLTVVLVGGLRMGVRLIRERILVFMLDDQSLVEKPALVVGAGDAGEMIIREIGRNPRAGLRVRAIFDDDKTKQGLNIHGIKVHGSVPDIPAYVRDNPTEVAIVAVPSATATEMQRFYETLKPLHLSIKTLPALNETLGESPKLTHLRDINITDLLGRPEVQIDTEQVHRLIEGQVVLVTGAGGSIGSELCRQVIKRNPRLLLLMDRSENNLFHIHRQLEEHRWKGSLVPLLCDVTDEGRLEYEFERFHPSLVFHAAAYKHVSMQEFNAAECFRNNIGGMKALAAVSHRFEVDRFLLISTDKAVHPVGIMGATKRICEIYCQAFGKTSSTRFVSVRFGNVLASEGSVVPIFLEQISRGGPVKVTHPEMRRYFMTIPEAVTLVLQATALGESGQILVLEMGEPVKIVDLARHLITLSGKDERDVPIEFVGLRPGEKLLEELYTSGEWLVQTAHTKIKVYNPDSGPPDGVIERIDEALSLIRPGRDEWEVRRIIQDIIPEYTPSLEARSFLGPDLAGSRGARMHGALPTTAKETAP